MPASTEGVYVGLEVTPWATIFVGGGMGDHQLGMTESDTRHKLEAGILVNLIDHEILDPTLFEDKLRVNAGASWAYTEAEWVDQDVRWQELTAFLTVSVVNDTTGNKFFNPNSVAVYAGPLFNYIQSDEIELRDELGFLAGIEIFLTESISLDLGMRHISTTGFEGGLRIDF
jgi:opacity protein-like surface antigen